MANNGNDKNALKRPIFVQFSNFLGLNPYFRRCWIDFRGKNWYLRIFTTILLTWKSKMQQMLVVYRVSALSALTGLRGVHRKLSFSTDPTYLGMSQWFPPIFRLGQFFWKFWTFFPQWKIPKTHEKALWSWGKKIRQKIRIFELLPSEYSEIRILKNDRILQTLAGGQERTPTTHLRGCQLSCRMQNIQVPNVRQPI